MVFLAALLWSLNGVLIKLVNDQGQGLGGISIAFYRSLFAGLVLLPLARKRFGTLLDGSRENIPFALWRLSESIHLLFGKSARAKARGSEHNNEQCDTPMKRRLRTGVMAGVVCFALMTTCFVVANTKTEAANAIILQYTSTFWVFVLSPLLLHERAAPRELVFLALALIGIFIIFAGQAEGDLWGLIIALGAGLFYGLLTMVLRHLRHCDSAAVTVVNNLGSAVVLLPFVFFLGELSLSTHSLLLLILMGAVQLGLPYYLFSLGLVRIPAYQAALVAMVEPVLVPLWTYLGVGEVVPRMTLIGGVIILTALVLFVVSARGRRREPST